MVRSPSELPPPSPARALKFHFLPALRTRRSISVPGPPALSMADTYAVVQKRAAPVGTGAGAGARARGTDDTPVYSQVTPRAWRHQAPSEDARGAQPSRGKSRRPGGGAGLDRPPPVPPDPLRLGSGEPGGRADFPSPQLESGQHALEG